MTTTASALEMREISPGVAEVYADALQVGMITWNPNGAISAWYATYANGDETIRCACRSHALDLLQAQHAVAQRLARSIRFIRPAPELRASRRDVTWDQGYNNALRDVEHILREAVGQAPEGEGYTAITRPTD